MRDWIIEMFLLERAGNGGLCVVTYRFLISLISAPPIVVGKLGELLGFSRR